MSLLDNIKSLEYPLLVKVCRDIYKEADEKRSSLLDSVEEYGIDNFDIDNSEMEFPDSYQSLLIRLQGLEAQLSLEQNTVKYYQDRLRKQEMMLFDLCKKYGEISYIYSAGGINTDAVLTDMEFESTVELLKKMPKKL